MFYGSVCSGIEAASVAWCNLGWKPTWFSETDPFCCSLLSQRYPHVANIGDINWVGASSGPINILVGGTPCQSFSVTGLRQGMADARGNLTLQYLRLLDVLRPRWFVYENVPGILSADGGGAFSSFVSLVAECGYGFAWRVLDSKNFGVPQRRRRVFVVGHSGGQFQKAGAVLFDTYGHSEHAAPAVEARQETASGVRGGRIWGWTGDTTPKFCDGVSPTLRAQQGGEGAGFATIQDGLSRFTVTEWERLQGFPDGYTHVEHNGRSATDAMRKRAIGNAFPVPVVRWIGERIRFVENHT